MQREVPSSAAKAVAWRWVDLRHELPSTPHKTQLADTAAQASPIQFPLPHTPTPKGLLAADALPAHAAFCCRRGMTRLSQAQRRMEKVLGRGSTEQRHDQRPACTRGRAQDEIACESRPVHRCDSGVGRAVSMHSAHSSSSPTSHEPFLQNVSAGADFKGAQDVFCYLHRATDACRAVARTMPIQTACPEPGQHAPSAAQGQAWRADTAAHQQPDASAAQAPDPWLEPMFPCERACMQGSRQSMPCAHSNLSNAGNSSNVQLTHKCLDRP